MQDWYWFFNIAFPLARWAHVVCTTLLVGGVVFYEFVVPAAIADLPETQQFAVLGNVRWVFRRIVVFSVIVLVISGLISIYQLWEPSYKPELASGNKPPGQVVPWAAAHMVLGLIAMLICLGLTTRKKIPNQPLLWLRISLMIMLVSIFVADVARHIRLSLPLRSEFSTTALTRHKSRAAAGVSPTTTAAATRAPATSSPSSEP